MPRKHKNEHNRQKIGEMPKSIMSKLWSIIDSSLQIVRIIVIRIYSILVNFTIPWTIGLAVSTNNRIMTE